MITPWVARSWLIYDKFTAPASFRMEATWMGSPAWVNGLVIIHWGSRELAKSITGPFKLEIGLVPFLE